MQQDESLLGPTPDSNILIDCLIRWKELNALLAEKAESIEITDNVSVESLVLSADPDWITAEIQIDGKVKAVVDARLKVQAGDGEHALIIPGMKIDVRKGGILTRSAEWLVKTLVGERTKKKLINRLQAVASQAVQDAIHRNSTLETSDGIKLTIEIGHYNVDAVAWDAQQLHLRLHCKGRPGVII